MLNIGCHLSIANGFFNAGNTILSIGGNTFQFFTRNPQGGKAKKIDENDINKLLDLINSKNMILPLAHASYTMNLCSNRPDIREFAKNILKDDLNRMSYLPNALYNFHPGSHVKQGVAEGIKYISETLNEVLENSQTTTVLLETMAGKGTEIGRNFEELKEIIDNVELNQKLGICLDTCHIFDAGYDIVNNLDGVLKEFDEIIGLNRLKAIHLNDSLNTLGSHKDRHAQIGKGNIGLHTFKNIINHEKLKNLPFYLETPNELDGYKYEIELLKSLC